jgi:hypothetical protein
MEMKQTCRVCGFEGPEVAARVRGWHDVAESLSAYKDHMRLCDLCACIGSVCCGADGSKLVATLAVKELVQLLHQVIYKIQSK